MKIAVCVKQIIDTEAVIELDPAGTVAREGQSLVIDPYSEFAVEEAVRLKEQHGGEVVIVCAGDQGCSSAIRHAIAMGADSAVLIEDEAWQERDAAVCAAQLAEVLKELEPDLILGGWRSGDTASAQKMGRIAARLGLPFANMVTSLDVSGSTVTAVCEVNDGAVTSQFQLPLVVAAQQGLAEPRYPSVRDVMQARRKPIETRDASQLQASSEKERLKVVGRQLKPARTGGRIVEGPVEDAARETARLLKEEAKVL